MAVIVGAMACSHSPLMITNFDKAPEKQRENIVKGFETLRRTVKKLQPDVILSISNDHMRELNLSNMPQFMLGIGDKINTLGDWGLPELTYLNKQPFARFLLNFLVDQDFDMSYSTDLKLDHGHAQILYYLSPECNIPVIPLTINTCAHPFPSFKRCYNLGTALRKGILSYEEDLKILIVASGGLSHWPSTPKVYNGLLEQDPDEQVNQNMIEMNTKELEAENSDKNKVNHSRVQYVREKRGYVNQNWDRWFLECMEKSNTADIIALTTEEVMDHAGNGGQETRNWVCLWGAIEGSPARVIAYEAITEWITGMALVDFQLNCNTDL